MSWRFSSPCLRGRSRSSRRAHTHTPPEPKKEENRDPTADPQATTKPPSNTDGTERTLMIVDSQNSHANIILNHDFSEGLNSWHPNCCEAYIASRESGLFNGVTANSGTSYAVVTRRTERWQGLEQDITGKVTLGSTYTVSAFVRVHSDLQGPAGVEAMLKLEYLDSASSYVFIGRMLVSKEHWEMLEGTFSLTSQPNRVIFYFHGPSPGVDLLIDSVTICCTSLKQFERIQMIVDSQNSHTSNIILNHDFSEGLNSWYPNCCEAYVASRESGLLNGVTANSGTSYAVVTKRTEKWQGLEQDITGKVTLGSTYIVSAFVRVHGDLQGPTKVKAMLKLKYPDSATDYLFIRRMLVSEEHWEMLEGTFSLTSQPNRVIFYLGGPSPGVDMLIDSVMICCTSPKQIERMQMIVDSQNSHTNNIILNHDFSEGLNSWRVNCCEATAYIASRESRLLNGVTANSGTSYAVVTNRTKRWQGLEQDITLKVTLGSTYTVSAFVRVHGDLQELASVSATLKLVYLDSTTGYLTIGRMLVPKEHWEMLEGTFSLTRQLSRVVFYLEGPSPGVDLLIDSVTVCCTSQKQFEVIDRCFDDRDEDIIKNPHFEDGLNNWSGRGCEIVLDKNVEDGRLLPLNGNHFASATNRSQNWNGIQQEITGRVQTKLAYEVSAIVQISGNANYADVQATLWVLTLNGREQYISIGSLQASNNEWVQLKGKFLINGVVSKVVIYLEGPPSGIDILVDSLVVKRAKKPPPTPQLEIEGVRGTMFSSRSISNNIIANHDFSQGLHSWFPNCCDGYVVSGESRYLKGVTARTSACYAAITNRTQRWQGLEQDITEKVSSGSNYTVSAYVRIGGGHQERAEVIGKLKLECPDASTSYIQTGRALASTERWEKLEGSFALENMPKRVVFYLHGPPPGFDLLIDSVVISHSTQKQCQNVLFGVNIIENSTFSDGLKSWSPLGSCTLSIHTGSPELFPSVARCSLGDHQPLSGRYVLTTNRSETWMGPSQTVTDKVKLHLTYQVAAWVRVGSGPKGPQNINVALNIDNQWINGGQVEVNDDQWHELAGSFRIEKQPSKVVVYVDGPLPGVDLMLAGLNIFPVDRKARFDYLKKQTDKVRKRDVILKLQKPDGGNLVSLPVRIRQIENSFPFGSCINRSNLENEEFVNFFVKNFNWAVFENELKWKHTEPEQGNLSYHDADEMLEFCERHHMQTRGHCIFWEVEDEVQPWVQALKGDDLRAAIQNRLTCLLSRYKGRFRHYDVNNEMLHGSFYQDRLGMDIRADMFREAHQLDPSATLFVNDYHVEDGYDAKSSSPEKYIDQIRDLQERGALVGGIGIQGHIDYPVGPIICAALDKLAILGLPIWITELDVCAVNEHVRADDLEVMLREAYAHPAVEGIVMWGFWEILMWREHSHLVDAEGDINEAGKRYLALKEEWLSHTDGLIDANGEFIFRGYQGQYTIEIDTPGKKISKSFVVDRGQDPLLLTINL